VRARPRVDSGAAVTYQTQVQQQAQKEGSTMSWTVMDEAFDKAKIELNGNKYLIANGYMGYRGTLEEYTKEQFTGCILAGLYDQVGDKWREPINAPNGLYTKVYCDGEPATVFSCEIAQHRQSLDIRAAVHRRETTLKTADNAVVVESERFLSADDVHLMALRYTLKVGKKCSVRIETGIDGDVWDINGPHLREIRTQYSNGTLFMQATSNELRKGIAVAEYLHPCFGSQQFENQQAAQSADKILRVIELRAEPGIEYSFVKYVAVYTDNDGVGDLINSCADSIARARGCRYDELLKVHTDIWEKRWASSDVRIEGDPEAQLALRYSIYHMLAAAPFHSKSLSIAARGLSSQVYKGAIFWDTELYMLPFFIYTQPEVARHIVNYRIDTLDGARRKAAEYGYRGAFYAWESQEEGQDACTHYAVNDVFTGRPLRTYFRDKQIHISADVVYGIWQYYQATGDFSVILDGGADVILECARFYLSYSYFKKESGRYEILDVTGPDEYHERVHNNAYTNAMAKFTVHVALEVLDLLKRHDRSRCDQLLGKLDYSVDLKDLRDFAERLYVPEPNQDMIIEQFDGYLKLEDVSIDELKARIISPNEYLGGPAGIATNTQIIKQSDTVLMLNLFKDRYPEPVKRANWDYYEPRTEHGSSLSACVYSMLGAHLGKTDYAYKYFMKTATIDLTGDYKQCVGDLFIGGTHLASNGGAWLVAVLGFAGMQLVGGEPVFNAVLPDKWERLQFKVQVMGKTFEVDIDKTGAAVWRSGEPCRTLKPM
jgi:nigerose phosphorylase